MDIVHTEKLTKAFDAVTAVDSVSISVPKGEIFGIVGPDGAGKTTLMRLLTAIMEPTSGQGWIAGHHIVNEAEAIKEKIGYMSQRFGLYPDLTVLENIHFYADIYGVSVRGRAEKIEHLLAFSNLTPFKKRLAGNLSGGMKQKLGLSCALIHTPDVLFLDEPTNGVDPLSRRDFWRILYQLLRDGVTILVSTAYLDEAERCSRVGLMHNGSILAVGSPDQIKTRMKGTILEIQSQEPRAVHVHLSKELNDMSVSLFGDRVHVVTTNPEKMTETIRSSLNEATIEFDSIETVAPSLEDVFVSVLSSKEMSN